MAQPVVTGVSTDYCGRTLTDNVARSRSGQNLRTKEVVMLHDVERARQVLAGVVPVGLPLSNMTAGPAETPGETAISLQG